MARDTTTYVEKGPGLARGPALIVGTLLTAFGLLLFLKAGNTPNGQFPDGDVSGPKFLGFETNGWTAFFTITAGALLLFGAAQHLLAKTMSLLVGLALGACAVIALVDGHDVLGLAAANGIDALGWGIAAAVLLVNALVPRTKRERTETVRPVETRTVTPPLAARSTEPVAAPVARRTEPVAAPVPQRTEPVVAPVARRTEPVAAPVPRRTEPVVTRPVDASPLPGTQRIVREPDPSRGALIDPAVPDTRPVGGPVIPPDDDPRRTGR